MNDMSILEARTVEDAALVSFDPLPVSYSGVEVRMSPENLPFDVEEVSHFIFKEPGIRVNGYANKSAPKYIFALSGEVFLELKDGKSEVEYSLSDPCSAVYIPEGIWTEFTVASPVIVVSLTGLPAVELASDRIENYDQFLEWKNS